MRRSLRGSGMRHCAYLFGLSSAWIAAAAELSRGDRKLGQPGTVQITRGQGKLLAIHEQGADSHVFLPGAFDAFAETAAQVGMPWPITDDASG